MLFAFEDNAKQDCIMEVLFPVFLSIQGPYLCCTGKVSEREVASFLICAVFKWFWMSQNNGYRIIHLLLHGWGLRDLNRQKEIWKYYVILTPNKSTDTETLGSSVPYILFIKMAFTQGWFKKSLIDIDPCCTKLCLIYTLFT